jgi:hypothetical protein
MKKTLTAFLFVFLAALLLFSQTTARPADAMPSAEQIIDLYIEALGGKAAIEKITSRVSKGTIEIPAAGLNGTIETYTKTPDKFASFVSLSGVGEINRGYDGKIGWSSDPIQGTRELEGSELALIKRAGDLQGDLKFKTGYTKMTVKGKEKIGDREAYVIDAVPTEGSAEKLFFDAQTGLLLRRDFEFNTPQGKMLTENYAENYREVDGVKIAFTQRQVLPVYTAVIKTVEVKNNVPIDDAKFSKPAK